MYICMFIYLYFAPNGAGTVCGSPSPRARNMLLLQLSIFSLHLGFRAFSPCCMITLAVFSERTSGRVVPVADRTFMFGCVLMLAAVAYPLRPCRCWWQWQQPFWRATLPPMPVPPTACPKLLAASGAPDVSNGVELAGHPLPDHAEVSYVSMPPLEFVARNVWA